MTKIYRARVSGNLAADDLRIDAPLDGKASVSRVTTLSYDADSDTTELEVRIETGRKHQIRRHLSGIDHPIVGDRLYGTADSAGLQLTAVELAFHCPVTGRPVSFALTNQVS